MNVRKMANRFADAAVGRLTKQSIAVIMKSPGSWGVSGTLYQQSAIAGVMFCPGSYHCEAALCKRRRRLGLAQ